MGAKKVLTFFGAAIGTKLANQLNAFQMRMAVKNNIPSGINSILGNFHNPMDVPEAMLILGLK